MHTLFLKAIFEAPLFQVRSCFYEDCALKTARADRADIAPLFWREKDSLKRALRCAERSFYLLSIMYIPPFRTSISAQLPVISLLTAN